MKSNALRRIEANFGFFRNLKRNFCTQQKSEQFTSVLYTKHSPDVFEMTLNEPKKLNSLDLKMIKSMLKYVRQWVPENINTTGEEDNAEGQTPDEPVPKILLLSGNGKHFCAGGDIKSLYMAKNIVGDIKPLKDFFRYEYMLDYTLTRIDPILISLWNGYVFGGGVGLSINAPIRVATESTVFAMPGIINII
jgi:3-hydroxyisobutyryl-CoA hydrolase